MADVDSKQFAKLLDALTEQLEKKLGPENHYYEPTDFKDVPAYKKIKNLKGQTKVDFIFYLQEQIVRTSHELYDTEKNRYHDHPQFLNTRNLQLALYALLMRTRLEFEPKDAVRLLELYREAHQTNNRFVCFGNWPVGLTINQLGISLTKHSPAPDIAAKILEIPSWPEFDGHNSHHLNKVRAKLNELVSQSSSTENRVQPYLALGGDGFGEAVKKDVEAADPAERDAWYALFHHSAMASGSKPKKKFLEKSNSFIDQVGIAKFKAAMQRWLDVTASLSITEAPHPQYPTYLVSTYLTENNRNLLKGLVWTLVRFHDGKTLKLLANVAEKSFQKIPGVGPAAASLGNACIYVLAQSRGLEGVSHLSRLKLRIRQSNTQKLIQSHIEAQAEKQGLKATQIEEIAAPDFGLDLGRRSETFDDYELEINISGVGKVEMRWFKPDGSPQKSVPAFIKSSKQHSARLKKLRDLVKQIKQASTSQRDRIDRLYTEDMVWAYEDFEKYYLNHGLVSTIARKLIWCLETSGKSVTALFIDEAWQDRKGKPVKVTATTKVSLWHPIQSTADDILAWRDRLDELQIQQPMKQAYREVYLLTDAEIKTRIYSNRMAAHILKQHQFNSLAALRGWKYSLLGAYDDGRENEITVKELPQHGLKSEYWINEIYDDNDSFNDAGIWDYVATDQVRFINAEGQPVNLVDIPKLVFSEIMRDVDLFVGVASVGNDPLWRDQGGSPQARDYWQTYSFGDLTEVAKTRKQVLERLLPRLKLRDLAHIDGKFLIVDGKRHTYKIHIGSTNILIAPNDQYLCIVPGRGKDKKLDKVFLPFEGDQGLSIVLSKAFMLAEDDKITDPTILSQL